MKLVHGVYSAVLTPPVLQLHGWDGKMPFTVR